VSIHDRDFWLRIVSYGISFLTAILATVLCLGVQARADHREAQQREQLQEQAAQQHAALCAVLAGLDDNAVETPATTPLGRKNAKTYASLRVSQGCPPRTEK
jgi:type II secretory pathway pseudopilin PulG